jgi:uracil-DNA glycosylase family 4
MSNNNDLLAAMDIDVWVPRDRDAEQCASADAPDLASLEVAVSSCTRCELHTHRTQTVFGTGDPDASWLIVGEAPGAEEDRRGEPFVGRAGQLLNSMLAALGLSREEVFIANILKCRPPQNRDPKDDEVVKCASYLSRQVALIKPSIILVVGRVAAQNLLGQATPIGKMRGQRYTYGDTNIPVVVTYHPAYLLRSPQEKRKSWEDLKFALRAFEETV